jgi:hypothetical protein
VYPSPDPPSEDKFSIDLDLKSHTSRVAFTQALVRTILSDLHGMEEYALWSNDRVLYIPTRNGQGRVCIETRVRRYADWGEGIERDARDIRLTYRQMLPNGDFILKMRDVRLKGPILNILRRVRKAALEGLGQLEGAS